MFCSVYYLLLCDKLPNTYHFKTTYIYYFLFCGSGIWASLSAFGLKASVPFLQLVGGCPQFLASAHLQDGNFLYNSQQKSEPASKIKVNIVCNLNTEIICYIIFIKSKSLVSIHTQWEGITQDKNSRG